MKGIIYTRVSSGEQVEGTSLEFQEESCRNYCKTKGIDVVKVFREEGESAKDLSLNNRTKFLEALDFCRKHKNEIGAFVVLRLNRFARNTEDHFAVRKILVDYGTTLHSVTEPVDDSPTGKFFETIIAGASEYENAIRKRQCTDGMIAQLNHGIYPWKVPVGYRSMQNKKHGEKKKQPDPIDEKTFYIIQNALQEFSKGIYTPSEIANLLDLNGLEKVRGRKTEKQFVYRMINKNLKFYAGIIHNPFTDEDVKGLHTPMISKDVYEKIQYINLKKKPQIKRVAFNPEFPLKKTVLCGDCGKPLTGSVSTGNGGRYSNYHCYNKHCKMFGKALPKKKVEEDFVKFLEKITPKDELLELFRETVLDLWQEKGKSFEIETGNIKRQLDDLEERKKRIYEMREDGSYTKEEFQERREELETKILTTKIKLSEAKIDQFDIEGALNYAIKFISDLGRQWFDIQDELKPKFQKLIFPEGIPYKKDSGFGTCNLSLLYAINSTTIPSKFSLVDQVVSSWNQIVHDLNYISKFEISVGYGLITKVY